MDVDAESNWSFIVASIGIDDNSSVWSHMINLIAEMNHQYIEGLVSILIQNWIDSLDKSSKIESIPSKLEVANKMLQLCRGKKIASVEEKIASLICKIVQITSDEKTIEKMSSLVISLCSVSTNEAMKCLETVINHDKLSVEEKITILGPLRNLANFSTFFLGKMVIALIRHKDKVR